MQILALRPTSHFFDGGEGGATLFSHKMVWNILAYPTPQCLFFYPQKVKILPSDENRSCLKVKLYLLKVKFLKVKLYLLKVKFLNVKFYRLNVKFWPRLGGQCKTFWESEAFQKGEITVPKNVFWEIFRCAAIIMIKPYNSMSWPHTSQFQWVANASHKNSGTWC